MDDSIRIVTREQIAEALRGEMRSAGSRDYAEEQVAALYDWLTYPESKRRYYGGDQYLREILDELSSALKDWPKPLTPKDLVNEV